MTNKHTEGYYRAAYKWFEALDDGRKNNAYWAAVFDVDWGTIENWRAGGKVVRSRKDPDVWARAERMLAAGMSYKKTAKTLGNVSDKALAKRFPKTKTTEGDFALYLLEDGASYSEVERSTGIRYKELKRRYPGYEWTLDQNIDLNTALSNAKKKMPNHIREIFFGP